MTAPDARSLLAALVDALDYPYQPHNNTEAMAALKEAQDFLDQPQEGDPWAGGPFEEDKPTAAPASGLREALDWPTFANVIREVDGNHDLGAGELAERLLSHPRVRAALAAAPAPLPAIDVERAVRAMHRGLGFPIGKPVIYLHGMPEDARSMAEKFAAAYAQEKA